MKPGPTSRRLRRTSSDIVQTGPAQAGPLLAERQSSMIRYEKSPHRVITMGEYDAIRSRSALEVAIELVQAEMDKLAVEATEDAAARIEVLLLKRSALHELLLCVS